MDNTWAPLAPTKRHSLLPTSIPVDATSAKRHPPREASILDPFAIGKLPSTVVQRIFEHVPVTDLGKCALAARPLARFVADERLWARRLRALDWKPVEGLDLHYHPDLSTVPSSAKASSPAIAKASQPIAGLAAAADDDFGDFATVDASEDPDDSFGGFASAEAPSGRNGQNFTSAPVFSYRAESSLPVPSSDRNSAYQTFRRIAIALKPFYKSLAHEVSPTSSLLFSHPSLSSLQSQASILGNLARFVGPVVLGYLPDPSESSSRSEEKRDQTILFERQEALQRLYSSVREAADYLEGVLLSAFEGADARRSDAIRAGQRGMAVEKSVERSEEAMRDHAHLIWQLAVSIRAISSQELHILDGLGDAMFGYLDNVGSSAALSFLEKREVLFRKVQHDPTRNIVSTASGAALDFTAMDTFMKELLASVKEDGSLIARVFPEQQDVLLAFGSRVANEVMSEYINAVLRKARSVSVHLYLQSCAATFAQAFRLIETLITIEPKRSRVTLQKCEPIVFGMWEIHMDEYLQEERDWVKEAMADTCDASGQNETISTNMDAAFLNSQNPAAVKRNVLTGFKHVLLMPVTVVPRAAGAVGGAVFRTAGTGLSQLNPLRWQNSSASAASKAAASSSSNTPSSLSRSGTPSNAEKGYVDFSNRGDGLASDEDDGDGDDGGDNQNDVAAGDDDRMGRLSLDADEWSSEINAWGGSSRMETTTSGISSVTKKSKRSSVKAPSSGATTARDKTEVATDGKSTQSSRFSRLQLLLSLDTALQLIQLNRESLKRMETFAKFSGSYGSRVKEEMEEIAVLFFQCLSEKHVTPGFEKASEEIRSWKPSEHDKTASTASAAESTSAAETQVAPLVHFFELVHVGDTIQQMVQVYYDQELGRHIDRTDFLNGVVREKKRFEGALDESVASGLNVGVDLLMGQAEWLITTHQDPRDYYPEAGSDLDLANPTRACRECIECLRLHCKMLVGSTDKTVLEVFYQEVGMRLHATICKHLKRQIISLDGGFKVIADLNAYQAFIASLRQPTVTSYFDALKMLGNLYIIDNPKELAAIVRDANMFNGTLSPEDLYEFLQARCDFKAIEKAIDKEIYGFKATEDCCIM